MTGITNHYTRQAVAELIRQFTKQQIAENSVCRLHRITNPCYICTANTESDKRVDALHKKARGL